MSDTAPRKGIELDFQPDELVVVTRGGWRVEFNEVGEAPQISHNGLSFTLADGVMVPAHVANDKPIDGAPALMRHKMGARYGLTDNDIGQEVYEGIALLAPRFKHINRYGVVIDREFDYFVALKDTRFLEGSKQFATYTQDIQRIVDLEEVCGHRGILLPNDAAIYDAAENDPAKLALWHMPTLPLVNGRNMGSDQMNPNNMYVHKDNGALRGTFTDKAGSDTARWYWSATERRDDPSIVYAVGFSVDVGGWVRKDFDGLSSRPVRAALRPAA